jgi:hypothetical protein
MTGISIDHPSVAEVTTRIRGPVDLGEPASPLSAFSRLLPVWCFVAFSALCVVVMIVAGAMSSHSCHATPIPLALGTDPEISIRLPAGTACPITAKIGSAVIDEIAITGPPKRGTLAFRGRTGVIYRPHASLTGEDAFAFSLASRSNARTVTSVIRVRARIE